jgi:site-specific DNA-methyltransferase (adenine-specific)
VTVIDYDLVRGEALAVLRELPDASVDAVITDPPYSSGGMMRGDRAGPTTRTKYASSDATHDLSDFSGDNRDQRSYAYWCTLWLAECLRVTRTGGVAVVFSDWRQLPTVTDALQAGGWVWRGIVPWTKPNPRPQLGRFDAQCEYAVWGSAGRLAVHPNPARLPGFYEAQPLSARARRHLTEKPLTVMRALVRIVPPGGIILDPFMGSGTTGVAALNEGRRFIGVEISDSFFETAWERIRTASTGHRACA